MEELVEVLAKALVDQPDKVVVNMIRQFKTPSFISYSPVLYNRYYKRR
ncbi:MAG: hypothetical protein XD78_1718 [Desulfotomaculum sp. 46_296]|nr:MAG: hypothetical protein XD78_1718 [Desulfotomaculum sp. 46_296]